MIKEIDKKEAKLKGVVKTGRTHLVDAMPIEFSQELSAWSAQLEGCKISLIPPSKDFLSCLKEVRQTDSVNSHRLSKIFCRSEKNNWYKRETSK